MKNSLRLTLLSGLLLLSTNGYAEKPETDYTTLLVKEEGEWVAANYSEDELLKPGMVCVRFNNYWCIKSPTGKPTYWNGQVSQDARGHAQFTHPRFAARAFVKLMRTYYLKYSLVTAFQIMNRYAPPTDTIGSIENGRPNPTQKYAIEIARSMGKKADDDLMLFDSDSSVNEDNMIALMKALSIWEITAKHKITDELAKDGIALISLE